MPVLLGNRNTPALTGRLCQTVVAPLPEVGKPTRSPPRNYKYRTMCTRGTYVTSPTWHANHDGKAHTLSSTDRVYFRDYLPRFHSKRELSPHATCMTHAMWPLRDVPLQDVARGSLAARSIPLLPTITSQGRHTPRHHGEVCCTWGTWGRGLCWSI